MYSGRRTLYDYDHEAPVPRPRRSRRRKRRSPLFWLITALVLGLLLGFCLGWFLRGLSARNPDSGSGAPDIPPSGSGGLVPLKTPPDCPDWIGQDFLSVNDYSRPGTKLDTVNGVVVHYVGNPGTTARQNHSYFQNLAVTGETYASSHFLVGLDGEIIQNIPLDEVAYCSNGRNSDTISIECCHPDAGGEFTQATYDALVKLVAWLQTYYELDTSQIIRHYDVTGKECPLYYVRNPQAWEKFLSDLNSAS